MHYVIAGRLTSASFLAHDRLSEKNEKYKVIEKWFENMDYS